MAAIVRMVDAGGDGRDRPTRGISDECRADRYFAYAALWDVAGYVQLGEIEASRYRNTLQGELEILLRRLV